jgi:hypothetical protein
VAEAPAPANVGDAAVAEARRRVARVQAPPSPSGRPGWYRWAGTAAGIAAALLLLTLVLPHVGSEPTRPVAEGAAAPSAVLPEATSVEAQNIDYDLAGVEALATSYGGQDRAVFGSNSQSSQVPVAAEATPAQRVPFAAAVACLDRAFTDPAGQRGPEGKLVRVIQARFRGTSAILGVYLIGPGAGQPVDIVRVLVASSRDCSILTSTQATT